MWCDIPKTNYNIKASWPRPSSILATYVYINIYSIMTSMRPWTWYKIINNAWPNQNLATNIWHPSSLHVFFLFSLWENTLSSSSIIHERLRGMLSGSRSLVDELINNLLSFEWFRTRLHSPQLSLIALHHHRYISFIYLRSASHYCVLGGGFVSTFAESFDANKRLKSQTRFEQKQMMGMRYNFHLLHQFSFFFFFAMPILLSWHTHTLIFQFRILKYGKSSRKF